ncbi:MAG: hypothetical protein GX825_02885 [Syntrophomonadaceae bacterium]|nr:hypothetical protein [Syntrophomonadaceae bacterium]
MDINLANRVEISCLTPQIAKFMDNIPMKTEIECTEVMVNNLLKVCQDVPQCNTAV